MNKRDSAPARSGTARTRVAAAALWLVASASSAQLTTFDPSLFVGYFTTDNVRFVGEGQGASDSGYRLGLELPVTRQLKKGTFQLGLSAYTRRYDDFDAADFESYSATLSLATTPKRTSSFRLQASYTQTQDQGNAESTDDADLFLRQRLDSQAASANLAYTAQLRNRWEWGFSLGASQWAFDAVPGFEDDPLATAVEDRNSFGGTLQVGRTLSRETSAGLRYGYRRFDLDLSGEEETQSLSVFWRREVAERLSVDLSVGAFESTGEAARGPDGGPDASRSGAQGALSVVRSWRYTSLSVTASHAPSAGGARLGTSTNSSLGVSLSGRVERRWRWGLSARYATRDPSAESEPEIDSLAFGAQVQRRFAGQAGIRLGASYVDQSSDEPADEGSFLTADLGVVWFPLGRRRSTAGGSP